MTTATDADTAEVLRAEESFFAALLAVESGALKFREVVRDPTQASVRHRRGTAVVVGRTRMTMRFLDSESSVESRYTHVYTHDADGWRLLSAQGTPVIDPPTAQ
jgi:ketosteroid isomerase-like protein